MPRYRQIADDLRAAIESGQYPPGSRLPTKEELKRQYGVAVNTVERAIEELRRLGLAESAQGSGTYARKPAPPVPGTPERLAALERRMDQVERRLDGH